MNEEIRGKLEEMRRRYESLSPDEILKIEWQHLDSIEIDSKTYKTAVWSEQYNGKRMHVVQLTKSIFLGVKQTDCIGSLISPDGTIEHIDEEFLMCEIGHP